MTNEQGTKRTETSGRRPTTDLRPARLSALAGTAIALATMAFAGCSGDEATEDSTADEVAQKDLPATVTWHEHIAPLVVGSCQGCHTEGGIAPFSMESYEQSAQWHRQIAQAVTSETMPPWGAQETDECTPPADFKDDLRLSDYEKRLFQKWSEQDAPEGERANAAELPNLPELTMQSPDLELTIPGSVDVEGTEDQFKCFRLDPEFDQDVWLTGMQVEAGNSEIVHHAIVYLDENDESSELVDESGSYDCFGSPLLSTPQIISAWAPGSVPTNLPEDAGLHVEAGSKLVMQVHYHPTGDGLETDDSTKAQFRFVEQEPEYTAAMYLIGNFGTPDLGLAGGEGYGLTTGPEFLIPAGAQDHVEGNRFLLPEAELNVPFRLWVVGTHMHYVGTDMKISVVQEGKEQCLVQTPNWDFNWQRGYFYEGEVEELPAVYPGDVLDMRCTYDNSLENPFVREALEEQGLEEPVDVKLGDETLDEMCLGVFGVAINSKFAEALP